MQQDPELFREKQHAYGVYGLFLVIGFFIFLKYDTNTAIFPLVILALTAIVFSRLTVVINNSEIAACFGLGLFKRKMKLSEINYVSIQKIKIKWWTGVGIRSTTYGWLYNVKPGEAIRIESTDKSRIFFVGTREFSRIKQTLSDYKNQRK